MKPISPEEAIRGKRDAIPPEVYEIVNQFIIEEYCGHSFSINAKELKRRILAKMKKCESWWLDFEPAYRDAGWEVKYDGPGYNETYEATYDFSPKRL